MGCTLRASTIQRIWCKAGGCANPSAFKSGPGGVAKFARGHFGEEKFKAIPCNQMQQSRWFKRFFFVGSFVGQTWKI
jgi:hypothetical protein